MNAQTFQCKSPDEIPTKLKGCFKDGFIPTLALVFPSISQDISSVREVFKNTGIQVFGATTSGEFIDEEIGEDTIVVMLMDLNPEYFRLQFFDTADSCVGEASRSLGIEGKKIFSNPAFIIVSGWTNIDGEEVVKGILEGANSDVAIYGGMAGDDLNSMDGSYVFSTDNISKDGLLALIIDENHIKVEGIATCGWKPVGTSKTVTKGSLNVIYTLDDKPALDMAMKYLGSEINPDLGNEELINIGAYFPLQLEREDGTPVMRTVMFGNVKDRSLICAGNVPEGSKVRFSLPPDFEIIDIVAAECQDMKEKYIMEADAVIMFSCISRYLSFGVMTSEEICKVKEVWNAPFIGFFSFGEYGKSKQGNFDFHNNTCCIVTLQEKN
jgi:hypothetical protein